MVAAQLKPRTMLSANPATEEVLAQFELHDRSEIDRRLDLAVAAQSGWRRKPITQRVELLKTLAAVLRSEKDRYARLITYEMGKPIEEARAEIEKCALTGEHYASRAIHYLDDELVSSNARDARVVFDPLGLLLAVMPWNYPFWQVMRAALPALAAGNAVVLKHASNVPQCALALEELFVKAGTPAGLFVTLLAESEAVESLIQDPRIAAVTFTGSTPVGRRIAAVAGNALKKQVLELGGSDPFIVLADADVRLAARSAAKARFSNTGQSCISAKRFIVEDTVADEFVKAFCEAAEHFSMGDPLQTTTRLGPLARSNLRGELHGQVQKTLRQGAQLRIGGTVPAGRGYFYPATILDRVQPGMIAATQETFGPVAAVVRVRNPEEAIAVANDTEFGLASTLWTADLQRARALSRQLEAGAVFINALAASDPRLPFGGIKHSGYGRELGIWGLREFVNVKTVWTD